MTQGSSTTAFAKSTRPEISGVLRREALFSRLDGTPARSVAWISAPPGFGKTTLAASYVEARDYQWAWYQVDPDDDDGETFLHYLAHATRKFRTEGASLPTFGPEHRGDVAAFARRFFRALFAGVAGPTALVLDNLHELSADSPLLAILEAGLAQVPRRCCIVVTSRTPPPLSLARLLPGGQMVQLGADDLRITPPELAELARLRGKPLMPDALLQLHQRADGWAAALVLMVEHHRPVDVGTTASDETTPKAVFDYLAGEIFERFEASTQRLLLHVACLPRVTVDLARALSGDETAGRVLLNLALHDYFVRELVGAGRRVFLFHPLLREFLLRRAAQDLPDAVGADALRHAARLLRESGQPEEAVALFVECQDWPEVATIAVEQADTLLAQGRHATLAGWLELLPPQVLAHDAALLQAHGSALLQASPRVARRRFEQAFDIFRQGADARGMARCCLGVIEALLGEFDDLAELDWWLAEFDRCDAASDEGMATPAAVMVARLWRGPVTRSLTEPGATRDANAGWHAEIARSTAALLTGDLAGAESMADGISADSGANTGAMRVALALATALRQLVDGQPAAALTAARAGLAVGAAEAVHGHDSWLRLLCAAAALGLEDADTARTALSPVEVPALRRGDRAFVHGLRAWLARSDGNSGAALREYRAAALLSAEAGLPWLECLARLAISQLLAAAGDRPGAEAQLRGAEALAVRLGSPLLRLSVLFTQAAAGIAFDDEDAAAVPLQAGLALARELGVHHVTGLPPSVLGSLCAVALRRGMAADPVRSLIGAGRLAPPPAALRLRQWPWAFQITTLGRFALLRAGEAIEFSAKGPGRPVELLKVLVSLGGREVRADQLADALWPRVDADYAHKSFTATLHRLRRLFGEDEALKLSDGRLSLHASICWLDTWALDDVFNELDARLREGGARDAERALRALVEDALALYPGPFLSDEVEQPAYIARREQLRARLLRTLGRVARRWEDSAQGDAAVDCYLRCIDADELCEGFYRQLMQCHQRRGELVEAQATYRRLQAALAARLAGLPSAETQALHAGLRS